MNPDNPSLRGQIDLEWYTENATRTESLIDNVKADSQLLINTLVLFINSGELLDQIKKHVFYGKPYDAEKINAAFINLDAALNGLHGVVLNESDNIVETNTRVFHAILGIATEATELTEALYKQILGGELDVVNTLEENGDIHWYQAIMMDELNGDWAKVFATNIKKLQARYPEKFTSEDAINRDIDAEREILEKDDPSA